MKSNIITQRASKSIVNLYPINVYIPAQTVRYKWVKMLSDDGYNILATIKKPMKHLYNGREFKTCRRIRTVEKCFIA